ncbi:MAG: WD40 repeat domain-containing protein, partial [Acidobacteriota bacterium]
PTALVLEGTLDQKVVTNSVDVSPDGQWLATGDRDGRVKLWPRDGSDPITVTDQEGVPKSGVRFGPDSSSLVTRSPTGIVRIWSVPEGELIRTLPLKGKVDFRIVENTGRLLTFSQHESGTRVEWWPLGEGDPVGLGDLPERFAEVARFNNPYPLATDPLGSRIAYSTSREVDSGAGRESEIFLADLERLPTTAPRPLGRHNDIVFAMAIGPGGRLVASDDRTGEVRIWRLDDRRAVSEWILRHPPGYSTKVEFSPSGSKLAVASWSGHVAIWDLQGPVGAKPQLLSRGSADLHEMRDLAFDAEVQLLASTGTLGTTIWPLIRRYPVDLSVEGEKFRGFIFLPDGKRLVSISDEGKVRLWSLGSDGEESKVIFRVPNRPLSGVAVDPAGKTLAVSDWEGSAWIVPLDGGPTRSLEGTGKAMGVAAIDDQIVIALEGIRAAPLMRVWDLATGRGRSLETGGETRQLMLLPDRRVISNGHDGVRIWNLEDESSELLTERAGWIDLSRDGRFLLASDEGGNGKAVLYDVQSGSSVQLDSHHGQVAAGLLDPTGTIAVTLPYWGPLQVGRVDGGPVHLLVDDDPGTFGGAAVSPDSRWIGTLVGQAETKIRLWPMPDVDQPPLQTLSREELLEKLKALTNVRVVADEASNTGWKLDIDPFPGWEELPTW